MKVNQLGKTGLQISALSFGSMRWQSEEVCYQIIQRGLDLHVRELKSISSLWATCLAPCVPSV